MTTLTSGTYAVRLDAEACAEANRMQRAAACAAGMLSSDTLALTRALSAATPVAEGPAQSLDGVPDGWAPCSVPSDIPPEAGTPNCAYAHAATGAVVVEGTPPQCDDEAGHNCDDMGCGSVGPHIIWRRRWQPERPAPPSAPAQSLDGLGWRCHACNASVDARCASCGAVSSRSLPFPPCAECERLRAALETIAAHPTGVTPDIGECAACADLSAIAAKALAVLGGP